MRNVVTHSAATEVRVDLRIVADSNQQSSVRLVVDDNGRGFSTDTLDERAADGHVGLRSLAGLVADLGGVARRCARRPAKAPGCEVSIPIDDRLPR